MILDRFTKTTKQQFLRHSLFSLQEVSIKFGPLYALKNINLKIDFNEFSFVTGDSGAGKTTFLRLLAGELAPSSGTLTMAEQTHDHKSIFITKVFQNLRLMENKTCEENLWVSYDKKIHGSKNAFYKDVLDLAQILKIKDRLNDKIFKANGGLKQKVAIIRAILPQPQVILADEPTSSLDIDNAYKLYEILNYLNLKRKTTILWASHNRELVKKFSGRIIHLEEGRLHYSGDACFI